MRDILFRGKRMDNGEWVVGRGIVRFRSNEEECFVPALGVLAVLYQDEFGNIVRIDETMITKVCPSSVGQFTGFLDKYGTKIFEGDILAGDHYPYTGNDGAKNYYALVEWDEFGTGFYLTMFKAPGASVKGISEGDGGLIGDCWSDGVFSVIGNIKDNPDLVPDYMF